MLKGTVADFHDEHSNLCFERYLCPAASGSGTAPLATRGETPSRVFRTLTPGRLHRTRRAKPRMLRYEDKYPVHIVCYPSFGLWHGCIQERRDYRKQQVGAGHKRDVRGAGKHREL